MTSNLMRRIEAQNSEVQLEICQVKGSTQNKAYQSKFDGNEGGSQRVMDVKVELDVKIEPVGF